MKKAYLKPQASAIAFVVNENIAASFGGESAEGTVYFTNSGGEAGCNKMLHNTGIATNLEPGDNSIEKAMANIAGALEDYEGSQLAMLKEILDKFYNNPKEFVCV